MHEKVLDFVSLPFGVLEVKTKDARPYLPFLGLLDLKQSSFSKFFLGVQCLKYEEEALNKYLA